jgi:hypothetical protein
MTRRHHTELQPLSTRPTTPVITAHRNSMQTRTSSSAISALALPSPSIVAARAFYLEHASPIGPKMYATQRRKSLIERHQMLPRRHSVMPTPGGLATQLENITFSANHQLQTVPEADEPGPKVKIEDESDSSMSGLKSDGAVEAEIFQPRWRSTAVCGTPQEAVRQVPFQYTHDHLRDWGYAYLGNGATADAFVNAVSLRRPSLELVKEEEVEVKPVFSDLVTIRARVIPKGKERKPFLIQRQFDIDELRKSIPPVKTLTHSDNFNPNPLRRSSRVRRSSVQQIPTGGQRRGSAEIHHGHMVSILGKGAIPIRKSSCSIPHCPQPTNSRY